jgi:hypothetical protein
MTGLELSVGAMLAVLAVLFVARPFLRRSGADAELGELDEAGRRRLEAAEERDRALAALKELELDHRTGKVSDDDYRELVGPLRRQAAAALRALDRPRRDEQDPRRADTEIAPERGSDPGSSGEQVFGTDGGHTLDASRPSR